MTRFSTNSWDLRFPKSTESRENEWAKILTDSNKLEIAENLTENRDYSTHIQTLELTHGLNRNWIDSIFFRSWELFLIFFLYCFFTHFLPGGLRQQHLFVPTAQSAQAGNRRKFNWKPRLHHSHPDPRAHLWPQQILNRWLPFFVAENYSWSFFFIGFLLISYLGVYGSSICLSRVHSRTDLRMDTKYLVGRDLYSTRTPHLASRILGDLRIKVNLLITSIKESEVKYRAWFQRFEHPLVILFLTRKQMNSQLT